jgi:hypothetical protein
MPPEQALVRVCGDYVFLGFRKTADQKWIGFFENAVLRQVVAIEEPSKKNLSSGRIDMGEGVVGNAITFQAILVKDMGSKIK